MDGAKDLKHKKTIITWHYIFCSASIWTDIDFSFPSFSVPRLKFPLSVNGSQSFFLPTRASKGVNVSADLEANDTRI